MIPLFEKDGFIIAFEAEPEYISAETHFIEECGWTRRQFNKIKNYPFFVAKVSAWKDGEEKGTAYLGACCYRTVESFYTEYKDDYFKDMVAEALVEAKAAQN